MEIQENTKMPKTTEKTVKFHYPTTLVLLSHVFFGGAIGGFLLVTIVFMSTGKVFKDIGYYDFSDYFNGLILGIPIGMIFGFVPAFFTAAWLSYKKTTITSMLSYIYVGFVGLTITTICIVLSNVILFFYENNNQSTVNWFIFLDMDFTWLLYPIGALTAIILAAFVLPKPKH